VGALASGNRWLESAFHGEGSGLALAGIANNSEKLSITSHSPRICQFGIQQDIHRQGKMSGFAVTLPKSIDGLFDLSCLTPSGFHRPLPSFVIALIATAS
jgi:hypothetical protein